MEDREKLQREVLRDLISYSENLIPAVQEIIEELRGEGKDDTKEFLGEIIQGINWEIEVYNQCASLINEKSNYIDKREMIQAVRTLGDVLHGGDQSQIADCLDCHFIPFLNKLALAAKLVI